MREFFRGWQRKVGVATLMVACMLMIVWMRSYVVRFSRTVPSNDTATSYVVSSNGYFMWVHFESGPYPFQGFSQADFPDGSHIGGNGTGPITCRYVPYCSIVLPMTLLSAYLLLSKPRPPKNQPDDTDSARKQPDPR
jgi:hypothetical protein